MGPWAPGLASYMAIVPLVPFQSLVPIVDRCSIVARCSVVSYFTIVVVVVLCPSEARSSVQKVSSAAALHNDFQGGVGLVGMF